MQDRDEYSVQADAMETSDRPLSSWEQKQQEKLEKQMEAIRHRQEALEEKHREAMRKEAERQAKILAKQEEKEAKRRAKQEKREAREREKQEAREAKERARQEAKEARENRRKGPSVPDHDPVGTKTITPSSAANPYSGSRTSTLSGRKARRAAGWRSKKEKITAQHSIPYKEMSRDGICRVQDKLYSKTIRFYDINYQLAQPEDKNAIFSGWCDFLNYFDSSIHFQISFINHKTDLQDFERQLRVEPQGDAFDDVRQEYSRMLQDQFEKGKNGLMRTKYITFSIVAENIVEARPRLDRIETDLLNNFKVLGVKASPLNGVERLKILYETFNPEQDLPFSFRYDMLRHTGLTTKDFVAPTSFDFRNNRYFHMGETIGAASYLQILAAEFKDEVLKNFLEIDKNLILTMHIQSIDHVKAIKAVKQKMTEINSRKIDEQKRAFRSGYDMDIIPSDLNSYGNTAKGLLDDLQSRNERLFLVTILFLNTAKTKQELDTAIMQTSGLARTCNCILRRLDFRQEAALMSSLPLGQNLVPIARGLTTTSTAIFVPFTTQELFMGGESLYYGLNALSNNLIMVDRKLLKNPNGIIIGTPGSGKSFAAKREIVSVFVVTKDDVIICDPEGEYYALVQALGGQVIHISAASHDYINPMDINLNYADDDSPLGFKADFILSLCELIMGSRNGIEAEEKSVIDRCLPLVYQKYFENPIPENMPILGDLYETLRKQPEIQAQRIATALEIYVNGSLKVFNHRTNVELDNRIVCFDIKDLGKQLKKLGMLIVQDQVWNRVTTNRYAHKATRYYVDEFHLLLKEEQTAAYSVEIWKRFRKWGGMPTGITQNIKDLLASREIENIFEDSEFIYMLNQAAGDRQILAKHLNISPRQLSHVTNSNEGEGLMFCGNVIIPFKDHFNKDLKLYSLMTTKPEESSRGVNDARRTGNAMRRISDPEIIDTPLNAASIIETPIIDSPIIDAPYTGAVTKETVRDDAATELEKQAEGKYIIEGRPGAGFRLAPYPEEAAEIAESTNPAEAAEISESEILAETAKIAESANSSETTGTAGSADQAESADPVLQRYADSNTEV